MPFTLETISISNQQIQNAELKVQSSDSELEEQGYGPRGLSCKRSYR